MGFGIEFGPVLRYRFARHRMHEVRSDFRHWSEHKAVLQHIGPGDARLHKNLVSIEQQINIKRSRNKGICAARPPCKVVDFLELQINLCRFQLGHNDCNQIQEIIAIESDRLVPVDRRNFLQIEAPVKLTDAQAQVLFRPQVTAQPQIDDGHIAYLCRRIRTPTFFAPRIAPGLLTRTSIHGNSNSASTVSAIFSAIVSTN